MTLATVLVPTHDHGPTLSLYKYRIDPHSGEIPFDWTLPTAG